MAHKVYRTTIQVRGYELDSFAHVNHAVYVQYMEHARWEMLLQEGITQEKMKEYSRWPIIAGLEAKYLRPTYLGEELTIETRMVELGKVYYCFEQKILRAKDQTQELVFVGKVKVVIVNEKGRPADIPEFMNPFGEVHAAT